MQQAFLDEGAVQCGCCTPGMVLRYRGDMPGPHGNESRATPRKTYRAWARQWSRTAWALALLFGSLPIASRLFAGVWGFDGAASLACLCLIVGTYFHIVSGRNSPAIPDPATLLDQALQLAASGRIDQAIAQLTAAIRLSPRLWQAFQYRGELHLRQRNDIDAALRDFSEAIRLAPQEPHLYVMRGQAHSLLGDNASARRDHEAAAALTSRDPLTLG